MFLFGISEKEDWFFTQTFGVYQRVNNGVYCYVSRMMGFYMVQLYERGTTGLCTLEARSESDIMALFTLGEQWLRDYADFNQDAIAKSGYYIGQQDWQKKCWI